ncbi:hypothetical protein EDD17DRAFT_1507296 [Pisolithus thermaeus]|nr:hypothetical protein EDD17DRAFT_1507296 [Pisolithus thermaeus]
MNIFCFLLPLFSVLYCLCALSDASSLSLVQRLGNRTWGSRTSARKRFELDPGIAEAVWYPAADGGGVPLASKNEREEGNRQGEFKEMPATTGETTRQKIPPSSSPPPHQLHTRATVARRSVPPVTQVISRHRPQARAVILSQRNLDIDAGFKRTNYVQIIRAVEEKNNKKENLLFRNL